MAGRLKKLEQKGGTKNSLQHHPLKKEQRASRWLVSGRREQFWAFGNCFAFLKLLAIETNVLGLKKDICLPITETLALSMLKLAYEN